MKKIDIHVHTAAYKGIPRMGTTETYASPEELTVMYEHLGIERGVILPACNPECEYQLQSMKEIMTITDRYPDRFSWFCNIDPRMGGNSSLFDLSYFLEYYKDKGARGVGEICANLSFDDPYVVNLFHHCEKNHMPVIFHMGTQAGGCYGLIDDLGLPRLEKALIRFPGLIFLGHSQAFWAEIGRDVDHETRRGCPKGKVAPGRVVELMRKYNNLYGDLSAGSGYNAVSRDPEFGYTFIEEFQDRLYFGTDICAPSNEPMLSFWLDDAMRAGKISESAYQKVCRGNATRLLGLNDDIG